MLTNVRVAGEPVRAVAGIGLMTAGALLTLR